MKNIITEKRLDICREDRANYIERELDSVACVLGEAAKKELTELYGLYDESFYIWLSTLWQPEIGGFYYSQSGRDTEGMLPDIESTVQAMHFASSAGLLKAAIASPYSEIYEKVKSGIVSFAKGLQCEEDGYFYHPQWGKNITTSRRGRDLGWATSIIKDYGSAPSYKTAFERLAAKDGHNKSDLPEQFIDIEKFKEYLESFDFEKRSYWSGNMLQSQRGQIEACGEEFVKAMFDSLNRRQRSDNGLWEPEINYASVNGLMKLTLIYAAQNQPLPNAERALESALSVAMSDEEITFVCQFYNPLITIANILDNINKNGDEKSAHRLREMIKESSAELIKKTRTKLILCKKPDGAYGYKVVAGICHSQSAPVALGNNESDVNGASISSTGIIRNLARIFGVKLPSIFGMEDSALFLELIDAAKVYPKINPIPDFMK